MPKTKEEGSTVMAIRRETLRKIKLVASLEGQTMMDWLETTAERAFQAAMHNRGRKAAPTGHATGRDGSRTGTAAER